MQHTGAKTFYLPSADYIWPRVMNARVARWLPRAAGRLRARSTSRSITWTMSDGRPDHGERGRRGLQHHRPPGVGPFFERLHRAGFSARGGHLVCTYFDENFLNMVPAAHIEGLYGCLDYYESVTDPFSQKLLAQDHSLYPGAREVHGRQRVFRTLPGAPAVGGGRDGDRVAEAGGRDCGARSRAHRRGTGWAGGDGAGRAPRTPAHVHRSGAQRPL